MSGERIHQQDPARKPYPFEGEVSFLSYCHYDRKEALKAWRMGKKVQNLWAPQTDPDSDSEGSDSTGSSGTDSSEGSGSDVNMTLENTKIDLDHHDHLQWYIPLQPTGRLHLWSDSKPGLYCACGKTLTRAEAGMGLRAATATERQWSPRCWAKMSNEFQELWADWLNEN